MIIAATKKVASKLHTVVSLCQHLLALNMSNVSRIEALLN